MNLPLSKEQAPRFGSAILALGFRPFFILGPVGGLVALLVWMQSLGGQLSNFDMLWHGHEMIHGFAIAIIVGFLYTASQSWTQVRGIHGRQLQAVAGLWLVGRVAFVLPAIHPLALATIDLLFLPLVISLLTTYLLRQGQRHNLIFLLVLFLLWSSNIGYHLARQGLGIISASEWLNFAVHLIIVMILVISSRILPFFTGKAIAGYQKSDHRLLDFTTFAAAGAFAVANLTMGLNFITVVLASMGAGLTLLRFVLWYDKRIWQMPILWVLYVAYLWLVAGFLLSVLAFFSLVLPTLATHAFTVGAISTVILGMISRVSLGHTGRPIEANLWTVVAFHLLMLGAFLRVFAPLLFPSLYYELLIGSGSLWMIAFFIFLCVYTPMLLSPRSDGQAA